MKYKGLIIFCFILMTGYAGAQESPYLYDDHGKRDPLWPLVNTGGAVINYDEQDLLVSDMVLEGIMTGEGGKNVAIINGAIVAPNDSVGLFVIKAIEPTMVILQKGSETFTLKIKKED